MAEFRTFHEGDPRPPTWMERERVEVLRNQGIEDVYLEPEDAPQEFWESLMVTVDYFLAPAPSSSTAGERWRAWERETTYATGWALTFTPREAFETIVRAGATPLSEGNRWATVGERFAAIEHLIDVMNPSDTEFEERVCDRARWFRVGVRMEEGRFVPVTSEHLHVEIVRPTLVLLTDERFAEVDALYRKAFERILSGDSSGAITAATSAVEQMLRVLTATKAQTLKSLVQKGRDGGFIASPVEDFIKKLYALRSDSDAHTGGTSDHNVAMLAIHISGSILLYLGKRRRVDG